MGGPSGVRCGKMRDRPRGIRTPNQPVMRPTSAFAAPFGFVGWTLSSPAVYAGCLPSSLYTFASN